MKHLFWLLPGLLLAGCTTAEKMVWVRIDGQRMTGNPQLQQQFEVDATICQGAGSHSAVTATPIMYGGLAGAVQAHEQGVAVQNVVKGCMAERGYLQRPAKEFAPGSVTTIGPDLRPVPVATNATVETKPKPN